MSETLTAGDQPSQRSRPSRLIDSRRFAWVDLGCALFAGALWYVSDGKLGPWPLLIAGIPWALRVAHGRFPVRRTRFDYLLWPFLATAVLAALVSSAPEIAGDKLWLIVGAATLFYALAGQRAVNVWPIIIGIGLFAATLAVYFFMTNDWELLPAKIDTINDLALSWMHLRPSWLEGSHQLHPNVAGGLLAMLFPLALAGGIRATRDWQRAAMVPAAGVGILLSASLAFTSSRGAWLALLSGLLAWVIWIGAGQLHQRLALSRRQTLAALIASLAGIALTVALLTPGGLLGLLDRLPGPASAGSRLMISRDTIDLIGDYPLLGAGLGAFDGLYSQYIRVIPNHFLIHSHNLFFDVGLEQGLAGLLLLLGMLGVAFWWLADPSDSRPRRSLHGRSLLAGALFASLVVLCVHGLVEDTLYGSRAVLLLWLALGLAGVLFPRRNSAPREVPIAANKPALIVVSGLLLAGLVFALANRSAIISRYESNRGALEMARVELASYPTNAWTDGSEVARLSGAEARFAEAVQLDPRNRTAWHRLGLLAMMRREYGTATGYLSEAHELDPAHRGINKALGYSEIWSGQVAEGVRLLATVPEAQSELGVYAWWWDTQERPELSQLAKEALTALAGEAPTP